jgi:putative phosphoesterase
MKGLLLGDTHGWVDDSIVELAAGMELVVHTGDIGSASVLAALKSRCGNVLAVAGNNDVPKKWSVDEHHVLSGLPESLQIELPGGVLAIEHGHRIWDSANYHSRLRNKYPDTRAIAYGHSHIRRIDTTNQPWVMNPGAAGRVRTKGGASCLVLTVKPDRWSVREFVAA